MTKTCHCGKPLHYTDPKAEELVRELVALFGETIVVHVGKRSFNVPRHYIALHGLKGIEVDKLGFEEIKKGI